MKVPPLTTTIITTLILAILTKQRLQFRSISAQYFKKSILKVTSISYSNRYFAIGAFFFAISSNQTVRQKIILGNPPHERGIQPFFLHSLHHFVCDRI